jgi:DNA-binding transcriptional LysR family regulator
MGDLVSALQSQHRRRQSRLSLGSLPSLATGLLPDILRRYREQHPSSEVAVTDGTSEILYAGIETGHLDLAISSRLPTHSGVTFRPLLRERFLLVLRRDHPLAAREVVTWREALEYDFVAFLRGSGGQAAIDEALERAGLVLSPVMTLAQSSTVLGMVEAGVGVTALPVLGCPTQDHRVLTSRVLAEPAVYRDVGILRDMSRPATAGILAVEALTLEHVAGRSIAGIDPAFDAAGPLLMPQLPRISGGRKRHRKS